MTLRFAIPLVFAAAPAFASGPVAPDEPVVIVRPEVAVAPAFDWTGFSVGAQIGYADVDTNAGVSDDGFTYGLRAYYDYDLGDFIVGAGIQFDGADIELDGASDLNSVLRVGARAGVDSGQNWYYFTAGYARAYTDSDALDLGDSDGYFVGLGYEVFLTDTLTAGAEVLYHEFDDFDGPDGDGVDAEATTFGLSVNYRF